MPLQNRVDPLGRIFATSARGTLMGNRGCLHDDQHHVIRHYQGRRWIICILEFKGRTHLPMPTGQYTSLFFLDEATALAAGHRPCAECQRERFNTFRADWAAGNPQYATQTPPSAATIDALLHRERIDANRSLRTRQKVTYLEQLDQVPDGTFIYLEGTAYLVHGPALYPWSFAGYGPAIARPVANVQVLTPRSIVHTLAHGYLPRIHPTALIPHELLRIPQ